MMTFVKVKGFTLIELMIALALSALILAVLVQGYISNKTTYRVQSGLARLQENARFAHYFLSKEIRMAGYNGCGNLQSIVPAIQATNLPANVTFTINDMINGYEATSSSTWNPSLPANLNGSIVPGSDVLVLRRAGTEDLQLTKNMVRPNTAMHVTPRFTINQGDIIMINDCDTADIFYVTNVAQSTVISHGANGNVSPNLSKAYQTNANIMRFETSFFYLKDTGRTNLTGLPIRGLYYQDLQGIEYELVEGVEDMQVTYGVDTSGDRTADTYQTADAIEASGDWSKVMSVQMSLLLNTVDEVNPKPQGYTFNGNAVANPGDRMLRRNWTTYITLRNRSL